MLHLSLESQCQSSKKCISVLYIFDDQILKCVGKFFVLENIFIDELGRKFMSLPAGTFHLSLTKVINASISLYSPLDCPISPRLFFSDKIIEEISYYSPIIGKSFSYNRTSDDFALWNTQEALKMFHELLKAPSYSQNNVFVVKPRFVR